MKNSEDEVKKVNYPTGPDGEGFYFESADDQEVRVLTKIYPNENKVKQVTLPSGKKAVVRELCGRDQKFILRHSNGDQERAAIAGVTVATTIDGQPQQFEFYENMKLKELNLLVYCYQSLNF